MYCVYVAPRFQPLEIYARWIEIRIVNDVSKEIIENAIIVSHVRT